MAKPTVLIQGTAAAWGDLAEISEPMLGNLFAVSVVLPTVMTNLASFAGSGPVISMLCTAAELPEETLTVFKVPTKLSDYDVVVGKERGQLSLTFLEQVGAPVSSFFTAWHRGIVDARSGGMSFPVDFRGEVWVAALTGEGTPYKWFGHLGSFPLVRPRITYGNDNKTPVSLTVPFSYIELSDEVDQILGSGSKIAQNLADASKKTENIL